jgi:hypothetical protein
MAMVTDTELRTMSEEERVKRLTITCEQLEKFENAIEQAKNAPPPEGVHPAVRVAEIEAMVSVSVDLREEATKLAHGRYICTKRNPWDKDVQGRDGRGCHPAAEDDGGCSEGCCDDYRCPYCGVHWRVEHDG